MLYLGNFLQFPTLLLQPRPIALVSQTSQVVARSSNTAYADTLSTSLDFNRYCNQRILLSNTQCTHPHIDQIFVIWYSKLGNFRLRIRLSFLTLQKLLPTWL